MRRFYEAVDLNKLSTDKDHELFFTVNTTNDILGIVLEFAKHNGSPLEVIRLYEFDNKTQWELRKEDYLDRCMESIRNV